MASVNPNHLEMKKEQGMHYILFAVSSLVRLAKTTFVLHNECLKKVGIGVRPKFN